MKYAPLILLVAVAGCAEPASQPVGHHATAPAIESTCRYEVGLAMAGVRERRLGDSIENSVRQATLMRQCREVRGAEYAARTPPLPRADGDPAFCSDPSITNPHLLRDCRLR